MIPVNSDDLQQAFGAFSQGQLSRAEEYAQRALRQMPDSNEAKLILAVTLAQLGRPAEAVPLFRALCIAHPEVAEHFSNLGNALLDSGDVAAAREVLRDGRSRHPNVAELAFRLGLAYYRLQQYADASEALRQAASLTDYPEANVWLAGSLLQMGERDAATQVIGAMGAIASLDDASLQHYGWVSAQLDQQSLAEAAYGCLLLRNPNNADVLVNLAYLYERANRLGDVERLLARVPPQARETPMWGITAAKLAGRRGDAAGALQLLLKVSHAPPDIMAEVAFEKGKWLDSLARYPEAYSAFAQGNAIMRDDYRRTHPTFDSDTFDWLCDDPRLDQSVKGMANRAGATRRDDPVFIVGFPRSGTTLLDQILDAHPSFQVMEEKPALEGVIAELCTGHNGYADALSTLTEARADALRDSYWRRAESYLNLKLGSRLVDKYPLNLARIHIVQRLFPRAHWIFAIRHPCDVVLSCFMQNFRFSNSTHGFWTIEQTAQLYVRVMSLWLDQRQRVPINCFDLRYEELVAELEPKTRALLHFLGVEWTPSVLNFHEHARARRITTPSYHQVVQPIYRTAAGRWRRYRQHFNGSETLLEPLAVRLGYSLNNDLEKAAHPISGVTS